MRTTRTRMTPRALLAAMMLLALVATACGGSDDGAASDTASDTTLDDGAADDAAADDTDEGAATEEPTDDAAEEEPAPAGDDRPETLVIDKAFDLQTADPGRQFEVAGTIVGVALYDTLLTFVDADVATPVPHLAESFEVNDDATEFTFNLRDDVVFADGSTLNADDVAFSLNRVRNLAANGSFLMEGVVAEAVDDTTVVLTSETSNPQLTRILPNPTLGIVNADLVRENGGTDGEDAATADTAEEFLNATSAGTGPYIIEQFDTTTETILVANPDYWGEPALYPRVVLRNVAETSTQALNIQSAQSNIVMDLASDQLVTLEGTPGLTIVQEASPQIWFLFANADPAVSEITSTEDFREAVRYGLDYDGILELAGDGAIRVPGIIPNVFLGALDESEAVQRDVERATAAVERLGGDVTVSLEYPSDFSASGLNFGPIAERVQANLAEVGITIELAPAPIASALENYRAGTEEVGLWLWNPDYPDPADYLVFSPGELVGLRAGWPDGADAELEALVDEVSSTVDDADREPLFVEFQQKLNETGVFFPLFQPTAALVATENVGPIQYHPAWSIDLEVVGR